MKKLLSLGIVVGVLWGLWLLTSPVFAQCTGVFPGNTLCGNFGPAPAPPHAISNITSIYGPAAATSGQLPTFGNNVGNQLADQPTISTTQTLSLITVTTSSLSIKGIPDIPYQGAVTYSLSTNITSNNGNLIVVNGAFRPTITFSTGLVSYPPTYQAWLYNTSTSSPQIGAATVTINNSSYLLWPNQVESVFVNNGNLIYSGPHRYQPLYVTGGPPIVFVGPSGSCANTNDGLSQNTSGQLCDPLVAYNLLQQYFDSTGHNPQVDFADGTYTVTSTGTILVDGGGPYVLDQVLFQGDQTNIRSVTIVTSGAVNGFQARDNIALILTNLTLNCNSIGSVCVSASQFATADISSAYIVGSAIPLQAVDTGHINFAGNITFGSNMRYALYANGTGAQFSAGAQTITCAAPLTMSAFAYVGDQAEITAVGTAFSGCASNVGSRYFGNQFGLINTGINSANYFPGNAAGSGPGYE